MERRMILMEVKNKTALAAGAAGLGLAPAGALLDQGLKAAGLVRGPDESYPLSEVLREMAQQVRRLSATIDSLVHRAG